MSGAGVFLIAVVVLLSGLLAYWGDLLGRHLGKKRLTLMRLRPRHTAAVITALAGVFASLLAIGVLVVFSEPVRVMLVEGERVKGQLARLEGRLVEADAKLRTSQEELGQTKGDLSIEQSRLATERRRLTEAQGQVKSARNQVQQLRVTAQTLRTSVSRIRASLAAARASLSNLKGQYDRLEKTYGKLQGDNLWALRENSELKNDSVKIRNELREIEAELEQRSTELATANQQAERLNIEVKKLESEREISNKTLEDLRGLSRKAMEDLQRVQNELANAQSALKLFAGATESSRFMPIIFSRGDELVRLAVGNRLNATEARTMLLAVLESADSQAMARGAKPVAGGKNSSGLVELRGADGKLMTPEMQTQSLLQGLTAKTDQQVLIVRVFANAFRDEFVPVVVSLFPNPVVYGSGSLVAETRIDGVDDQNQILRQLTKFLQDELSPKAVRDGIIPAYGKPDPLGEIDQAALLRLVSELSSVRRRVRVQFLAARETRAADRLRLDFRLR
ncbi:MAG: DUF3084 domain-containing protein [Fimbriimonadaceae bacterium]|nr:DUF3084 domain-containing protein [Fimbriimonadaceae bacterium]QYK57672.1 MAG: DUF3084 domain-containing protein [Fimbriimonadaceae bacterium]